MKGENHISLTYSDALGLVYRAFRHRPETNILESKARAGLPTEPVRLHWLAAPVVPGPALLSDEMIDFTGRWCGEFQIARTPWTAGGRYRNNRTGPHRARGISPG